MKEKNAITDWLDSNARSVRLFRQTAIPKKKKNRCGSWKG